MKIDRNQASNTSREAPVHSKDTILMLNTYKNAKDEMMIPKVHTKSVSGGAGVLNNFKIRG